MINRIIAVISICCLMSACGPSRHDIEYQKLETFLAANPVSEPVTPVNIASQYSKLDKLYFAVLAYQQDRYADAKILLAPYVEQNDADALFWHAKIIYASSIKNTPIAARMLLESIKQGNPYAMMAFSPEEAMCQRYFSSYCDEKYITMAQQIFAEQAQTTGDVRAVYYSKMLPVDYSVRVDAIIEAANNHYYYPLFDYAKLLFYDANQYELELRIKLLTYLAHHNFIPAIDSLKGHYSKQARVLKTKKNNEYYKLVEQGMRLGSRKAWASHYFNEEDNNVSNFDLYVIAQTIYLLSKSDRYLKFTLSLHGEEKIRAEILAQQNIDNMNMVLYTDAAHAR